MTSAPPSGLAATVRRCVAPLALLPLAMPVGVPRAQSVADAVAPLRWRCIGPSNMMGRIASIDASIDDHRTVLVASASGGVFLSDNAGTSWRAIFDDQGSGSIGDAVFCQGDPDVIWVGTGEASNRNSVGWGDGVYRSTDRGRSFVHVGLAATRQIAAIAAHPSDPDVAYVAAVGSLWGPSGDRGLFKTTDGGRHWTKLGVGVLPGPESGAPLAGCTEVLLHPTRPDTVWCAIYERLRTPWSMQSGGPNGGIFRSHDGGATWAKLTAGLPTGATGMIDLDVCLAHPDVLVANVEADQDLPDDLRVPGPGVYRSDDGGDTWRYLLRHNTRPFYHGQIAIDPSDPDRIYVVSRDFRVSLDGGASWRPRWWGGGGDDHDLWISPKDGGVRYMATDQGAYLTVDDGRTVVGLDNMAIGQYYAIGVDMRDPYHVIGGLQDNGVWIGPSHSREPHGITTRHNSWVVEGDGFHAQIDPTDWRTAYAVIHCGFAARVDLQTRAIAYVTPTPETVANYLDWFDPHCPDEPIRYTILPGDVWFYGDDPVRPRLPPQFRFNWSSPLVLSPHDPNTVYFAGNYLFESRDRGETWRIVSPDLTTDDIDERRPSEQGGLTRNVTGGENHCTIVTIGVSPRDPRVLWCGTDDGNVQVTRDGGAVWTDVTAALLAAPGAPRPGTWISRVEPSHHADGRCFVTLDDHRRDDFRPFVFATDDFGASWRDVTGDLPGNGSCYVVREDPVQPWLVFAGTEFGAWASIDGGGRWAELAGGLPTVAVHDLVIHPRDADLVAGTHGRSIWILDDLTGLRQLTPEVRSQPAALLAPRRATRWREIRVGRMQPDFLFRGANPPRAAWLHFWSRGGGSATIEIAEPGTDRRWTERVEARPGLNRVAWPLRYPASPSELAAARARLGEAARELATRAPDDTVRAGLGRLAAAIAGATSAEQLDALRTRLVRDHGQLAAGAVVFGARIGDAPAAPGVHVATLRHAGVEASVTLAVRSDPLDGE
ncbi:MAG: hypothetical protein IPM29_09810 [Planctomycetes bacterium]|nr:hypothetical protein [Planctomycetota bacterium]